MEHEYVISEADKEFQKMFLEMTNMVKELWEDLERRRETPHQNEGGRVETMVIILKSVLILMICLC
jgi:hypothetical protein